jgi:hypothetical protein
MGFSTDDDKGVARRRRPASRVSHLRVPTVDGLVSRGRTADASSAALDDQRDAAVTCARAHGLR